MNKLQKLKRRRAEFIRRLRTIKEFQKQHQIKLEIDALEERMTLKGHTHTN